MAPACETCKANPAQIVRPKDRSKLCTECFFSVFEAEIHHTITSNALFHRGEKIAIGASGGKDSTVLASVLKTLDERHDYGVELILLSIDEGIKGYRDDSLMTVKRNAKQYEMPLTIVGYDELYGWTMDQVVEQVGKKGNCTYCGVFRRQALDRGAARLGVRHVVTGHNADDVAETVLMNLLRGDLPRLSRSTSIVTSTPSAASTDPNSHSNIKRSKPLKYAYEKEIVLYAHHKRLDYFTTECIYSPEAFRGSARALIKNLERLRPSAILDVVRSGEDMAKLVPGSDEGCGGACSSAVPAAEEEEGGCGSANGRTAGGEMANLEQQLVQGDVATEHDLEVEITLKTVASQGTNDVNGNGNGNSNGKLAHVAQSSNARKVRKNKGGQAFIPRKTPKQVMGQCRICGYLSSQDVCKACVLLEGLNKSRPKNNIEIGYEPEDSEVQGITNGVKQVHVKGD
ncbi:hypothetical protein BCR34DRAFT_593995 [Clohesyomyces aquaticus]|uniref:Cytoplasmic tRNA 2-thiolation protein 1 n=1 Tax=Clohesyomyces aquaticus TaxID=1231657 RepID=A0A1Y1YDA5_9PLEO|nr:hypothetical protein BCR34DRAFT_593995 [Clohesyomyces aquaticus]